MEFLTKSNDVAGAYGIYPGKRKIEDLLKSGIIILDKWAGPTSHDVSATVRQQLGMKKVGHAGTLDPAVSGVLPLTLENACKVIPALQKQDKEYVGIMHLHKEVERKDLEKVIKKFTGKIKQLPPVRSAVKREVRSREIRAFDILEIDGKDVLFRILCEAGTYVRVVCHDTGKQLGGAHMAELRRIRAGPFQEERAVRIQDVVDAYHGWKTEGSEEIRDFILPVEAAVEHLPKIIVKDTAVFSVVSGTPLYTTGISRMSKNIREGELVAILTLKGELVSLSVADMNADEMMKRKGVAAKTDRVVMEKGIYPRM